MGLIKQLELFFDPPGPRTDVHPLAPPARAPDKPRGDTPMLVITRPLLLPTGARWREVRTPEQIIGFILRRSRRKSIGLVVNDDGLQITAPNWATLGQIDATVMEKSRWILRKLGTRQARQTQLATMATRWQDGGQVPYMGQRITLALNDAQNATVFEGRVQAPCKDDVLALALPACADPDRIRDSVHAWLQQRAAVLFEQRLKHYSAIAQLPIKRWRLSSAATRWGSCSSDGSIRLNWRLIHFDQDIIDYVIAHEVAHLREMNHSKAFWHEVGRLYPGFEQPRNALRQHDPACLPLI